jgi:Melibiase/Alpha galactosidase C-terminal beta sandwich domain
MNRSRWTQHALAVLAFLLSTQTLASVSLKAGGWTVTVDNDRGVFSASHEVLGPLLVDASFETPGRWLTEVVQPDRLLLRDTSSHTGWVFELRPDTLIISSTSQDARLHASVPAPPGLEPARLLDPQGTPVNWTGNNEIAGLYGGQEAPVPSFLPRVNADVMYFSLGRITSPAFHSLFDRQRDVAIDFPAGTSLQREAGAADRLSLTLPVHGNAVIRVTRDYYQQTLHLPYYIPFDDRYFPTAPIVWSSWINYYDGVSERDIVRNTDWLAANLKPYGFGYVELDDGYDRLPDGQHAWINHWNKQNFPHGPQWLATYIKSKGLRPGLWLVPNSYADAVDTHPDWYLRDAQGKFVIDYSTPALDSTHPAVMEHLRHLFQTLDRWGFEYYKFDGEHSVAKYAPGVDHSRLHDPDADLLQNYRQRLQTIRDTVGPRVFLEGCPAGTPLNGIGYFNSYFTGQDLYSNWQGMDSLFNSITGSAFLNHIVSYLMPGEGLELGEHLSPQEAVGKRAKQVIDTALDREQPFTGIGTTLAEARTLVSYVALTGVVYPLASVMPELPADRVQLLKATMPTLPIMPVDLFSRGADAPWGKFRHEQSDYYVHNYPEILDLKVDSPAGAYDVVALTNWRSTPETQHVDLTQKLGLSAERAYVAFDFWNQTDLGEIHQSLDARIEGHDTRVLFIRPLLDRPQLVGMSRHISGNYSIRSLEWASSTLRGRSEAPAGEPYTLWFHVPPPFRVARVTAHSNGKVIPVTDDFTGQSLRVRFSGQPTPIDWQVEFRRP